MKAKVYNRHREGMTHKENFKGNLIEIKAGSFIVMDYEDAVDFKGQYFPMKLLPTGQPDPAGWKMIEVVPIVDGEDETITYICNMDGKEFSSQAELDAYTKANYGDQVFKDDVLEETIKKRGRPAKDKTHEQFKT